MGTVSNFTISDKKLKEEYLRINISKSKKKANCELTIFKYRDKDTRQIVLYIPSLEVTGYGSTEEKAQEMIKFSIDDFFHTLCTLSSKKIETELSKLGWKHHSLKNKEYSKVYVDGDGELKNFNAVADKVERLTLVA